MGSGLDWARGERSLPRAPPNEGRIYCCSRLRLWFYSLEQQLLPLRGSCEALQSRQTGHVANANGASRTGPSTAAFQSGLSHRSRSFLVGRKEILLPPC